jgi:hypothetical protein
VLTGGSREQVEIALAFPDMPRFRDLIARTEWALRRLGIRVLLADGNSPSARSAAGPSSGPRAGPHSCVASRSRGCSSSHAAVGFSSSVDGWRTSGAVCGWRRCLLPLHHMSQYPIQPNRPVLKRCIQVRRLGGNGPDWMRQRMSWANFSEKTKRAAAPRGPDSVRTQGGPGQLQ